MEIADPTVRYSERTERTGLDPAVNGSTRTR
jgi:hypothetical protein